MRAESPKLRGLLCLAAVLLTLGLLLFRQTPAPETPSSLELPWPEEPVTLCVSADLHWQSLEGKKFQDSILPQLVWLEEIVDTLLDEAVRDGSAALLLCGDLTNNGLQAEHEALAQKLRKAEEGGLSIFVVMGNHDVGRGLTAQWLMECYGDFGWQEALSVDAGSMSYLAPVNDRLWVLSLDCNLYDGKTSQWAGSISDDTLDWIRQCLELAREAGAMVVPFSHQNLMIHNQSGEGRLYNIENGEKLEELFFTYGIPVHLSGHRHNSFLVEERRGDKLLVESVVSMPAAYPHYYTALTFRPDATVDCGVKSLDVDGWAARTGRTEPDLLHFASQSREKNLEGLRSVAAQVVEWLEVPPEEGRVMEEFYLDFYTHYQLRTLWKEGERLRRVEGLALWEAHREENIYARWMPWILANQSDDAPEQRLGPFREK